MKLTPQKITLFATLIFVLLSVVASSFFYYIPLWRHRKIYGRLHRRPHHGWGWKPTYHHHHHGHHHGHHHHTPHHHQHGWGWGWQ